MYTQIITKTYLALRARTQVQLAEKLNVELSELTAEDLSKIHDAFEEDVTSIWSMEASVESRSAVGGTGKDAVLEQVERLRNSIQ